MSCWNFAEAIYQLAHSDWGDKPALIHADQTLSYRELVARAEGIADFLQQLDLPAGSHVGHYLRNSNAYMESFVGAGLAGHSHVNVNFRYTDEELTDLCNGLDIRVLVYDSEFADIVAAIQPKLTATVAFIEVDGDAVFASGSKTNDFAVALSELQSRQPGDFQRKTSSDDLILIATGGTTGLPKGTQWRHEDMFRKTQTATGNALKMILGIEKHPATMEEHVANVNRLPGGMPFLSLSPLMHGAAFITAIMMMAQGNPVLTLPGRRFDPDATLDAVKRHGVGCMVLVGDAFAMPLTEALERRAGEKPIESLLMLVSSGAAMSDASKAAFQKHQPKLFMMDTLGSSEAIGYGISTPEAGVFQPMPTTRVFDEDLNPVQPGSDTIGMIYSGGFSPIGYYNEPEKSAETFLEIDGMRYVKTGDRCTLREDGMIVLLGRDSTVINTGGEKVYTVEVETVLVQHPTITDALVVGLPHERFGKQVVAVVEGPQLTAENLDVAGIQAHCREHLADYKVPKLIFAIDDLKRAPNGKPDYPFVTGYAEQQAAKK
ncbi:MAG: AMP-binding protein [Halieaceae bacterium]|jgi:fatty-acyl-CoA synthase|nr:AMP-binding protein [Halieaceae bacterium]